MATGFAGYQVLNPDGLNHIANHKYVPGKYTPLDNVLNPWWIFLTNLLPTWIAPNVVTLLGCIPMVLLYFVVWYVCPEQTTPPPSWLLFINAAAVFFYINMDAMDGKQARRTNSSSPLGQLFDHGVDCLCTLPGVSMVLAIICAGDSRLGLTALTMFSNAFFVCQWIEYHTGVLTTACGPIGITEVELGQVLSLIAAGIVGPDYLLEFFSSSIPGFDGWQYKHVVMIVWALSQLLLCCLGVLHGVRVASKKGMAGVALLQLLPPIMLTSLAVCWSSSVWQNQFRVIGLITGLHFVFLSVQVIVFSMAKQPFKPLQWSVLVYAAVVCLSHFDGVSRIMLEVYLVMLVTYLIFWTTSTMHQITSKLGIRAFIITVKQAE
eukprot:gnl/MRDRNA2_/MRDRNA2_92524_c0_seq1.p1 gnl/MRDRNA2_/MRDRNA2_92524_c0~~gnl/MRDRNA2_/MRDRNA2_92524_c0_seq1.p1  ORF type:complete len:377 (+),score=45.87 gnl/MRDRNA2_/MRDRNA2_92524_c0_seq1:88-1218(+)